MMQPVVKIGIAAILALQAAIGLYLGLPGQMSSDSIIQLYEGRTFHFISFNPPLMSLLLGALDRIGNAPIGFVVISQAMLSASTWLAFAQSGRVTALRLGLAAIVLLNPVVLIYVGIVWKDVLLAHAVVLVYLLIAWLRQRGISMTPPLAVLVLALLTVIVGVRQQGLLFALPAALWAATTVSKRTRLLAGIAFLALPIAANRLLDFYVSDARANAQVDAVSTGWRTLVQFDIAGILANGGELPAGTAASLSQQLRQESRRYSPYRVDTLTGPVPEFWALDGVQAGQLWHATIAANPGAYLRHRTAYFAALLGLDDMRTVPSALYGRGRTRRSSEASIATWSSCWASPPARTMRRRRSSNPTRRRVKSPLFIHLAYAAVLVFVGLWLLRRQDYVLATLAVCALLFLASYSVLGIACDFRYAYTLTVSTTLLVAYACLNWGNPRASASGTGSRKLRAQGPRGATRPIASGR